MNHNYFNIETLSYYSEQDYLCIGSYIDFTHRNGELCLLVVTNTSQITTLYLQFRVGRQESTDLDQFDCSLPVGRVLPRERWS
jgi:hypothetical protein